MWRIAKIKAAYDKLNNINFEGLDIMKKLVCIVFALAMMFAFTACTNKGTCEACGTEDVRLKTITFSSESYDVCENCYDMLKMFASFNLS